MSASCVSVDGEDGLAVAAAAGMGGPQIGTTTISLTNLSEAMRRVWAPSGGTSS